MSYEQSCIPASKLITAEEFAQRRKNAAAKQDAYKKARPRNEKRLEMLEIDVKYGYVAFLLIGDLLHNVINHGGLSAEIVRGTIDELLGHFKQVSLREPDSTELKLVQALKDGVVE